MKIYFDRDKRQPNLKRKTIRNEEFGFPVVMTVPVKQVRGEEVVACNANELRDCVLSALVHKQGRLTGNQVRMIRLSSEQTLLEYGEMLGVSHVAVHKWECYGDEPTRMGIGTEFLVRQLMQHPLVTRSKLGLMKMKDEEIEVELL